MKSKISFFNGTVLRKDITRFCPVWGLYLVFGVLWAFSVVDYKMENYHIRELTASISSFGIVNLIYGFVVAVMLFGDLFKSRLCNGTHALAPRRESWFATHCLAGLLFSLVPNAILTLIFLVATFSQLWYISLLWLLAMMLQYLFFFGLGVFSVMCCGNRFAAAVVYGLINFGSIIVRWFAITFYEPLLYGVEISDTVFVRLCPVMQLVNLYDYLRYTAAVEMGSSSIIGGADYYVPGLCEWYMLIIGILGLVLLGVSLLLYRRRKLECAGDFMAFRWMRPVFAVVFTLTVGALFEQIVTASFDLEYVGLAVGILVGYFIGRMLLQRTVSVFKLKTFAGCAAVAAALLVSIGLAAWDPLGIEAWVPEQDNIQSVFITYRVPGYYHVNESCEIPVLVDALVDVHGAILAEDRVTEAERRDLPYTLPSLRISYTMKDGREIIRDYYLRPESRAYQELQRFLSMPERILGYSDWEKYLSQIDSVSVMGEKFTEDKIRPLMELIRADCEAGYMYRGQVEGTTAYYDLYIHHKDGSIQKVEVKGYSKTTSDWIVANGKELYPS